MSPRSPDSEPEPKHPKTPSALTSGGQGSDPFACFHPVTAEWFRAVFDAPTAPQRMGWPVIARGESALILAPTGTGKTLTAFLWCLDRLMLRGREQGPSTSERNAAKSEKPGCRIVYVSPLKA